MSDLTSMALADKTAETDTAVVTEAQTATPINEERSDEQYQSPEPQTNKDLDPSNTDERLKQARINSRNNSQSSNDSTSDHTTYSTQEYTVSGRSCSVQSGLSSVQLER